MGITLESWALFYTWPHTKQSQHRKFLFVHFDTLFFNWKQPQIFCENSQFLAVIENFWEILTTKLRKIQSFHENLCNWTSCLPKNEEKKSQMCITIFCCKFFKSDLREFLHLYNNFPYTNFGIIKCDNPNFSGNHSDPLKSSKVK